MGFSIMLRGAEKLVPVEYWCPYGTCLLYGIQFISYSSTFLFPFHQSGPPAPTAPPVDKWTK